MLPYLSILTFIVLWVVFEYKITGRKSFWLPLISLSLFAGMRSYVIGTDSKVYTKRFISSLDIQYFEFNENKEIGYQLLEYTLLKVTHNYFWLFFITGLIVVYCYLRIIKIYSVTYWLSIFLFLTTGVYTFFFNGLRQGLAMAIFSLATPYLLEKKFFYYLLICFLASLFHTTALFMIPFYFLVNLRFKLIYKIAFTFIGSLFVSSFLISYISTTNEKYEGYAVVSEKAGGLLTLSFYFSLVILIYIISRAYNIKDESFTKIFTFYAVGVTFIIPIAMLGANASGPQRLLSYFTWTLVLLLPIVLKKINNVYIYIISIVVFILYFVLTTTKFSELTPYTLNPIFEVF